MAVRDPLEQRLLPNFAASERLLPKQHSELSWQCSQTGGYLASLEHSHRAGSMVTYVRERLGDDG